MLLSLMMCFSLMAIPAQAALLPNPDGPIIIDVGGPKDPGDDDSENPIQPMSDTREPGPGERDGVPID